MGSFSWKRARGSLGFPPNPPEPLDRAPLILDGVQGAEAKVDVRASTVEGAVLFRNSAERESVSLQGLVGPQAPHSRSTWRVLNPMNQMFTAGEGGWTRPRRATLHVSLHVEVHQIDELLRKSTSNR